MLWSEGANRSQQLWVLGGLGVNGKGKNSSSK